MRRSSPRVAGALALPVVLLGLLCGSPARAQLHPDPADVARAESGRQQHVAVEATQWRQPEPRSGSRQYGRTFGSADPRWPWQGRRFAPRPYWYDRWARRWPYPGYAGWATNRSAGWRGEGLWYGTKGFVPASELRYRGQTSARRQRFND